MSVHSTYYDDQDEYEQDLRWEYRKGNEDDIPFYDPMIDDYEEEETDEGNII